MPKVEAEAKVKVEVKESRPRPLRKHKHLNRLPNEVAEILRTERIALGLDLKTVAARMGSRAVSLGLWESGQNEPRWSDLKRWAEALSYDIFIKKVRQGQG